jgi:hypothetical protein
MPSTRPVRPQTERRVHTRPPARPWARPRLVSGTRPPARGEDADVHEMPNKKTTKKQPAKTTTAKKTTKKTTARRSRSA